MILRTLQMQSLRCTITRKGHVSGINYLLCALLCLLCQHAYATEWEKIIQENEVQIYADLDSYTETLGNPSLTTKAVFKSPQAIPGENNKNYVIKIRNSLFNCKEHSIKDLSVAFYSKDNKLLHRTKNTAFRPTNANKIDQQIESLTCHVQKMVGG